MYQFSDSAATKKRRKEVLTEIVALVNAGDTKLWDILTALRGPDFYDVSPAATGVYRCAPIKKSTTSVIRKTLGFSALNDSGFIVDSDNPQSVTTRRNLADAMALETYHFVRHAQKAFEALGLDWDAENVGF